MADEAGGHIHGEHPFLPGEDDRDPTRRLRGRLTAAVTLWTSQDADERAGLTVASVVMAEPGLLAGVIGQLSDLADVLPASGAFVVHLLEWRHRQLADVFAFQTPSPGGPFAAGQWRESAWGPVLDGAENWAGCRVRGTRPFGYGLLVEAEVEHAEAGDLERGLLWHRGHYV